MKGDYHGAIRDYQEALKVNPKDFKSCFNMGLSYDRMGDLKKAMHYYHQALRIKPTNAHIYYNMACVSMRMKTNSKAVEYMTKAIQLNPSNAKFFKTRGLANRLAGRFTQSASDYVHARALQEEEDEASTDRNQRSSKTKKVPVSQKKEMYCSDSYYEAKPLFRPEHFQMTATADSMAMNKCFQVRI